MTKEVFLVLNLTLAFYNVDTIWAHEVDIFRTWKLLTDPKIFHSVQEVHWIKLPYWVFMPLGIAFLGSIALFWYHPDQIRMWEIVVAFGSQQASHILTAFFLGAMAGKTFKRYFREFRYIPRKNVRNALVQNRLDKYLWVDVFVYDSADFDVNLKVQVCGPRLGKEKRIRNS